MRPQNPVALLGKRPVPLEINNLATLFLGDLARPVRAFGINDNNIIKRDDRLQAKRQIRRFILDRNDD